MMSCDEMTISVNRLRVFARHGVMAQEHDTGGEYVVSMSVRVNGAEAAQTDDIRHTVDYSKLVEIARREMAKPSQLLEHVAARMAKSVCQTFPEVSELWVEVEKLNPPVGAACLSAGVKLHVRNHKS